MTDRLPSLDLLLDVVQRERDKQLLHFEGLDTKVGVLLGFGGLLVTFSPQMSGWLLIPGVCMALFASAAALSALWPRRVPLIEPEPMSDYLAADERFTKLMLHDTLELMHSELSATLANKARSLRMGLVALVASGAILGAGVIVHRLGM